GSFEACDNTLGRLPSARGFRRLTFRRSLSYHDRGPGERERLLSEVNWWPLVEARPDVPDRPTVHGAVSWAARGSVAVTDQALLAGTNFLVNVFLARWMAPAPYGAFALALALSWLLRTANDAVHTGPLTLFGAGR